MIKKVILFCVTFIISVGISAQVKDDFELNIRQLILPGDLDNKNSNSDCLYKLTNNKFEKFFNSLKSSVSLMYMSNFSYSFFALRLVLYRFSKQFQAFISIFSLGTQ